MKNQEYLKETYEWKDLLAIVHKLRQPDGCPWDSTQTYESMKKCVTDEAAEVVEAVDNEDFINLREELGDLMLQVLMYAEIAQERQEFTLDVLLTSWQRNWSEDIRMYLAMKKCQGHPVKD